VIKVILLIAALVLSGCSLQEPLVRTEILEVPTMVVVPVPEILTRPCGGPILSKDNELTYGDVVAYSLDIMGALELCNEKLLSIRELSSKSVNEGN